MSIRGAADALRLNAIIRRIDRRLAAYERTGDGRTVLADAALTDAIRLWRGVLRRPPADMTDRERDRLSLAHITIGWLFHARWVAAGTNVELAQAVFHLAPVAHVPDAVPGLLRPLLGADADPDVQADTATAMLTELHTTSEPSYLTAVVLLLAQAAAATAPDSPALPLRLTNLGIALRHRYQRHGDADDLDMAVEATEDALGLVTAASDAWHSVAVNLSALYQQRYELRGDPADLDEAIRLGDEVVGTAPEDHPVLLIAVTYLGIGYQLRLLRDGALTDLLRAVELTEMSVAASRPDDPDRPGRLNNLSIALTQRYARLGTVPDLDRAIELAEESLAAVADDHPERALYLGQLAVALHRRADHDGDRALLDRAIAVGEQALASSGGDQLRQLAGLADSYGRRHGHTGDTADLARAAELARRAVALVRRDHHLAAAVVATATDVHALRHAADPSAVGADELRTLAELARGAVHSTPRDRVLACTKLAVLAGDHGDHALAAGLYRAAVALLPASVSRFNARVDQEERATDHLHLVGGAVAAHLAVGDPAGAVAVAELGRGTLLAEEVHPHGELTELAALEPALADRFRHVSGQLRATSEVMSGGFMVNTSDLVDDRTRLWAEYDEVVADIRRVPGFERFLDQPDLAELRAAAEGGAVVLVNAAPGRSDAVVITTDRMTPVPLLDLDWDDVLARVAELVTVMEASARNTLTGALRVQRVVRETLEWLSATIAAPLEAALPGVDRVWWLPVGVLGVLPLHTVFPDVVSSYTPTLRTLARARSRPPATVRRQLTVAVSAAPGFPTLDGTIEEAEALHDRHPGALLVDDDATTSRVRAELPACTWAHFACHAMTDVEKPSFGGLVLHDTLLPIGALSTLRLDEAELAYLSACSTAVTGVFHANESIHLTSACQLAGFRHVVGSLWPLDDATAAAVARVFYDRLPGPDANDAARVLHAVVGDLRDAHPDRPDLWAALVHHGP